MAELGTVAREWTRIGVTGFGGPPAHIALLRQLAGDREGGVGHAGFEEGNAACALLPGPSSTQLAIFCAYRVAGWPGAIVGGVGFIVPAVVLILALSLVFLSGSPPDWIRGAGAGAGAAGARGRVAGGGGPPAPDPRARPRRRRDAGPLGPLRAGGRRRGGDDRPLAGAR